MTYIVVEKQGRAGVIGLDRPIAMNALNLEMIRDIDHALSKFQDDPEVHCIVLQSNHDRAFCAGGDMRRVRELSLEGKYDEAERFFEEEYALIERISKCSKPYISLIDGICMGGGMGISVHGTYRIATERAVFAMPETAIGFIPDVGGSYFLSRMPHCAGIWMGLTGASVRGIDAQGLGISTHMTEVVALPELRDELCHSDRPIKDVLSGLCATVGYQPSTLTLAETTVCFDQTSLCGIFDCLERRHSNAKDNALKVLKNVSPYSLQETLILLQNGKELSLSECLRQEFEAMRRAIRYPDLAEGVRAVLVDKDHSPNWQSASL